MRKKMWAKQYSLLFLGLTLIVAVLSVKKATPPSVVNSNAADSVFSAVRAFGYLQEIATAPHSLGTVEHDRVANYIVNTCKHLGLKVELQDATETTIKGNTIVAANVHNIVAYTKGTKGGKAITNIAHYDSQPNTPGAADDGIGVAAMLETARALKSLPPAENDIMFLFTDAEEPGLFGAKAFVNENSLFKNVAVAINWDFRGNEGIAVTYETSAENGWIMREYARGIKYPYGNSMAFEISKRLPNFVDFQEFKQAGVTGFTSGMINGFTSYHSMTDNLQNLDQRSLQQVGDNMLSMVKRLENSNLVNTKSPNVSYFNVFGFWFVYYPASLNLIFVIITTLLFAVVLYIGFVNEKIKVPGFAVAAIALPATMALTYFASSFLLTKIIKRYPFYTHFDENNSYNSEWYFLSMTLLAIFFFSLVYQFIVKRWGRLASFAGLLLAGTLSMWALYFFAPSASWLLFVPLLFLLAGFWWQMDNQKDKSKNNAAYHIVSFISVLPSLLLFVPLTYLLFVSFGLGTSIPFVSVLVVFITALIYPVISNVLKSYRWLLSIICVIGLIFSLFMANRHSGYDEKHPLQASLNYQLNVSDSTAQWISDSRAVDKFTKGFFPNLQTDTSYKNKKKLMHDAPFFPLIPPGASIEKDSSYEDMRELTLFCNASRNEANIMGIIMDDSTMAYVRSIQINDKETAYGKSNGSYPNSILFFGVSRQGFFIKFTIKDNKKIGITLFDRSVGLPEVKGLTAYPKDVIPGQGFSNNTTQVAKHFVF
ncbi:MAG: M20/M25/M40 family metallo-hydrolase [Ginsengibacter sp.]